MVTGASRGIGAALAAALAAKGAVACVARTERVWDERLPGTIPTPFAYGGAKAALEHLTQAVAFEMQPHGVSVNALMPSLPVATPGLEVTSPRMGGQLPMADFCAAALRLLAAPALQVTGHVAYSEDVLQPELGRRGWLGPG